MAELVKKNLHFLTLSELLRELVKIDALAVAFRVAGESSVKPPKEYLPEMISFKEYAEEIEEFILSHYVKSKFRRKDYHF